MSDHWRTTFFASRGRGGLDSLSIMAAAAAAAVSKKREKVSCDGR